MADVEINDLSLAGAVSDTMQFETDIGGTTSNKVVATAIKSYCQNVTTADRAVVSNGSGGLTVSATTATEIGYVSGVTSSIQTQFTGIKDLPFYTITNQSATLPNSQYLVGTDRVQITNFGGADTYVDLNTNSVAWLFIQNAGACSVVARAANSTGTVADLAASSNDTVLGRFSDSLSFSTIPTGAITNDAVTDAKLRNSGACSVIGRSANSSGDPADISAASNGTVLQRLSDSVGFSVLTSIPENLSLPGDISPAQITANENNYSPTGLSTASTLRLSTDASRDITGLAGGADGRIILLHNVGAFDLVLKDESSSSTAANRFALNADVTLQSDQSTLLQYDSTSSRWRLIGGTGSGGGGGGGAPEDATYVTLTTNGTLTNERTLAGESTVVSITDGGAGSTVTVGVATNGITFAKIQQIATDRLLGRDTASTGNVEELSLSTGLEFTGSASIRVKSVSDSDLSELAGIAGNDQGFRCFRNRISVTANTTLSTTEQNAFLDCDSGSTITLTIPANSTTAFNVGTEFEIYRQGAGTLTVASASGVTVQENGNTTTSTFSKSVLTRYSAILLKKIATDTWFISGAIT